MSCGARQNCSEVRVLFMKFHENEVLCAAMWLYSRAMFDLGTYDDFILPCTNKNDQSKKCI